MMDGFLHLSTLGLAAVGVGALFVARTRTRPAEALAAILMLVGMTDAMTVAVLAPVIWFAVMLLAALALAARHRVSIASARPSPATPLLAAHLALGLVATAALILVMPTMSSPESLIATGPHAHGGSSEMPLLVSATVCVGTAALAAVALRSPAPWHHRVHHVAMAASTLAMGAVVIA